MSDNDYGDLGYSDLRLATEELQEVENSIQIATEQDCSEKEYADFYQFMTSEKLRLETKIRKIKRYIEDSQ